MLHFDTPKIIAVENIVRKGEIACNKYYGPHFCIFSIRQYCKWNLKVALRFFSSHRIKKYVYHLNVYEKTIKIINN